MVVTARLLLLVLTLGLSPLLFAETILDKKTLEGWISSTEELQTWTDQHDVKDDDAEDFFSQDPKSFTRMMADGIREHPDAEKIVNRHGFKSADHWAETATAIMNAYVGLQLEAEGTSSAEMQSQMSEALAQMENNPHLTDQQRDMMRQQMGMAESFMGELGKEAPEENIRLIRQHKNRLDQLFDAQ